MNGNTGSGTYKDAEVAQETMMKQSSANCSFRNLCCFFCCELLLQKFRACTHRANLLEHKVATQVVRTRGSAKTAVGACHEPWNEVNLATLARGIIRSVAILAVTLALRFAQGGHILTQALLDQLR